MSDNEKHLARIKALFSKTTKAGATEAEELAAAEKARELIEKYQIDLGAEELKKEGFIEKRIQMERRTFAFARRILRGIDAFCEVSCYSWKYQGQQVAAFGLLSDAEFAAYLIENLTSFGIAGADIYIAVERKTAIALGTPMTAAQVSNAYRSYLIGVADRITMRLLDLARQRQTGAGSGSNRALISLDKPALVKAEMERLGIRLHGARSSVRVSDLDLFSAGSAHGAKASFGRPVEGAAGILRIGKS